MAQTLAPTGTSARIIAFPNSAPQPVQQTRRAGRLPAGVFPAYKVALKREKRRQTGVSGEFLRGMESGMRAAGQSAAAAQVKNSAVEELRSAITNGLHYVADCQYRLALLTQTNKGAFHV